MCYHISQKKKDKGYTPNPLTAFEQSRELEDLLSARFQDPEVFSPVYHLNGFDHGYLYGVTQEASDVIEPMRWGFVELQAERDTFWDGRILEVDDITAYWKKKGGYSLNGTIEKVFDYYVTAKAIRYRRCIIPITGFFESKHIGKNKYPHFITPKDEDYFVLAGIYNDIGGVVTTKILTAPANPIMSEIHNSKKRQPVMLHPKNWFTFLNKELSDEEIKNILLTDTNQDLLTYTVSKDVTNSRIVSNREDILKEITYPELNTLF